MVIIIFYDRKPVQNKIYLHFNKQSRSTFDNELGKIEFNVYVENLYNKKKSIGFFQYSVALLNHPTTEDEDKNSMNGDLSHDSLL